MVSPQLTSEPADPEPTSEPVSEPTLVSTSEPTHEPTHEPIHEPKFVSISELRYLSGPECEIIPELNSEQDIDFNFEKFKNDVNYGNDNWEELQLSYLRM